MRTISSSYYRKSDALKRRLIERLVYLPGALIMLYGLWLSLVANA